MSLLLLSLDGTDGRTPERYVDPAPVHRILSRQLRFPVAVFTDKSAVLYPSNFIFTLSWVVQITKPKLRELITVNNTNSVCENELVLWYSNNEVRKQ